MAAHAVRNGSNFVAGVSESDYHVHGLVTKKTDDHIIVWRYTRAACINENKRIGLHLKTCN